MKKYSRKKMSLTLVILTMVLCVSIGYAALTSVLKINSTLTLGKIDFAIHFDNVQPAESKATVVEAAHIIDEAKKEISFEAVMLKLNDNYKFTTDIVNEGSIPGVIKSIELNGLTDSQRRLVNYSVKYSDTGKTLAVGDYIGPEKTRNVTVEVTYQLSSDVTDEDLPTDDMTFDCTFVIRFENGDMTEFLNRAAANRLMQDVNFMPTSALNFTKSANSDEYQGIYRLDGTENDTFPIYFYRGSNSAINNHVIFGGYCWRIVRTTETGGIKIIYNGVPNDQGQCTNLTGNGTEISKHKFTDASNNRYTDSTIKLYLTTWYFENLIRYQAYLEDTPFCNSQHDWSNGSISLACSESDIVSVANGKNTYPIGFISAPEANLCGLSTATSSFPWLYTGSDYWTISGADDWHPLPNRIWFESNDGAMRNCDGDGCYVSTNGLRGVRPVVSLNSEVVFDSGNGTTTNPYTVSLG